MARPRARRLEADSAGVSAYCVINNQLVMLYRPDAEKVESTTIGTGMHGRQLRGPEPIGTPALWDGRR